MGEPSLNEIRQGIVDVAREVVGVARGVETLASGSKDRELRLESLRLELARVQFVAEQVKEDLKRISLTMEGTNGSGLKSQMVQVKADIKTIQDSGIDLKALRRMWLAMILSVLGSITSAIIITLLLRR